MYVHQVLQCKMPDWSENTKKSKQRAAELRDNALFKNPPAKEDCPICFLPMPGYLLCCISLPPATISSVPIYTVANEEFANKSMEEYYPCCGKSICSGCVYSFRMSGNMGICPFCNYDRGGKTGEDVLEDIMKRVEANDPASIAILAKYYYHGILGVQQDQAKAMELYARAVELGLINAICLLADIYHKGGDLKKARFHVEAAAMARHEVS